VRLGDDVVEVGLVTERDRCGVIGRVVACVRARRSAPTRFPMPLVDGVIEQPTSRGAGVLPDPVADLRERHRRSPGIDLPQIAWLTQAEVTTLEQTEDQPTVASVCEV